MINEAAGFDSTPKNVLICDTQPVAVEGMKWLIGNSGDLRFAGCVPTLEAVYHLLNPEAARLAAAEASASQVEESTPEALATEAEASEAEGNEAWNPEALLPESFASEPLTIQTSGTEAVFVIEATSEPESAPIAELPVIEPADVIEPIDAVVIDKGLGLAGVMELLHKLAATSHQTPVVVWGSAISESEALRLLQAGARGILRRTSESSTLLTCLRAVTAGGTWMEDGIFGSTEKLFNPRRSQLTHRESEVVVLVEKGLRNSDIAELLGIRTGTVKIHLKHIFEKTGVRGRYGLAFTGLQNRGSIAMSAPPEFRA
jgi:DNA-binding NarL/FixJ family response regulator